MNVARREPTSVTQLPQPLTWQILQGQVDVLNSPGLNIVAFSRSIAAQGNSRQDPPGSLRHPRNVAELQGFRVYGCGV